MLVLSIFATLEDITDVEVREENSFPTSWKQYLTSFLQDLCSSINLKKQQNLKYILIIDVGKFEFVNV
jgi:hypothetical protein